MISCLKKANNAFRMGNYLEALNLYLEVSEKNPKLTSIICSNIEICRRRVGLKEKNYNHTSHDVVVCVHNAPKEVERCLKSLFTKSFNIRKVILVDDFSKEETKKVIRKYLKEFPDKIKLITNDVQKGYTKSANIGMKESQADVLTLLNSDTVVTKLWDKKIISHLNADANIGIIGPLSNAASSQSVPSTANNGVQTAINDIPLGVSFEDINAFCENISSGKEIPYTPLVHGFCMSITRDCLDKTGGFDEKKFPRGYGEENDFCMRAQDEGFALSIAIDTYIYHEKSKSFASEEREELMKLGWNNLVDTYGKNRLINAIQVMEKNPLLEHMRIKVYEHFYVNKLKKPEANLMCDQKVKSIAFYLPQFHPIKENDENWGEGFTEWTNVVKTHPRFDGHYQPKLPGKFGFYDLRRPEMMLEQSKLAAEYGLTGFCFYYYRFGKKRVMDLPLRNYLDLNENKLPFCFCWANESWTRAWDGKTSEVLLHQSYDEDTINGFIDDIAEACSDSQYLNIDGKPIVIIYQVAELDKPEYLINKIKVGVKLKTGFDLLIGSVFSPQFKDEMLEFVDFLVQFPPHRIPRVESRKTIKRELMKPYQVDREDYYEAYENVIYNSLNPKALKEKMFLGVTPDWDNSSRRSKNATTLVGSSPEKFKNWVDEVTRTTYRRRDEDKILAPVFFVNAWNEWAEGAVLEPTEKYGCQYLEALKQGIKIDE